MKRADERGDLGPHPHPGRGDGRGVLHLPGDAQEVGVVAGQPDDPAVIRPGRIHPKVPVRDPARQGGQGQLTPGDIRDLLQGPDEVVVQGAPQDRIVGH